MSNDNVRELRPGSSDVTAQVTNESQARPLAYATFKLKTVDTQALGFHFVVVLEPEPGVVQDYTVVIGYGADLLDRLLPLRDHRLPVALHYNPVVDATKPDGSAYALNELPLQEFPIGLYFGNPFVPLVKTESTHNTQL